METIVVIPASGGEEARIADSYQSPLQVAGPFLTWTSDSGRLVIARRRSPGGPYELELVSLEDKSIRRLTVPPADSWGDTGPAISPDGAKLLFTRTRSLGISELLLISLSKNLEAGGEPLAVPTGGAYPHSPVWIDNDEIVFCTGLVKTGTARLFSLRINAAGSRMRDQPAPQPVFIADGTLPAFSRKTGRLAYTRIFSDGNIWRLSLAGKIPRPETFVSSSREDNVPRFAPDGKKIAFGSSRSGSLEIWMSDSDGSHSKQLTSFGGPLTGSPAWSPDSRTVAFDSIASGDPDVYTVSAPGGTVRRLTTSPANDALPSWSRDGKWIYFTTNRTGKYEIWKVSASGGEPVPMHADGSNTIPSQDGRFVYFVKIDKSLWRIPSDGGREELAVEAVANGWSVAAGRRGIYFIGKTTSGEGPPIQYLSFETGKILTLIKLERAAGYGLAVSPDEKTLLYSQLDSAGSDVMAVDNFR
jgi:Tol biopolymer transport system component